MSRKSTGPQVKFRKDRGKWGVLEFKQGNRYWHVSGLSSRGEAEDALAKIIIERRRGSTPDPKVGEIMAYYLDEHVPHTLTEKKAASFHKILTPYWAPVNLSQV